jgi:hypothetical protein
LIPRRSPITLLVLVILSIATLGVTIWGCYQIASQDGAGGRFWIEWIAVRAKVVDGISPYSATASTRIQNQVGNVYRWASGIEPVYNSPLISAIITLPFAMISNKTQALTAWLVLQFVVILLTILAGMRVTGWKPTWWFFIVVILLILLSPRSTVSWYEGSMTIWVSGLVAAVLLAIKGKRFEMAGILLALTMIQPQVVLVFVVFVLIWAGSQRKWTLVFWFFSSLLILSLLAVFLVRDWPIQYLRILWHYSDYFSPGSPGYAFQQWWPGLGRQLGWIQSAILGLILFVEWWLARRSNFRWFLWTACLTLAISMWIGIPANPEAHLLLNLPLLVVIAMLEERWRHTGKWVVLTGMGVVFTWEWMLILTTLGDLEPAVRLGMIFPVPLLLLIGLFWVRWWTIRPKRLLIDELRDSET